MEMGSTHVRQAYCDMKCEEKGIDKKVWKANNGGGKGDNSDRKGRNDRKTGQKFNGLNELEKLNSGRSTNFAKISEDTAVVGRPMPSAHSREGGDSDRKKRPRENDDEEDKPAKREKPSVGCYIRISVHG